MIYDVRSALFQSFISTSGVPKGSSGGGSIDKKAMSNLKNEHGTSG